MRPPEGGCWLVWGWPAWLPSWRPTGIRASRRKKKLGAHELVYLADKYCRGGIWVPVAQRFAQKLEEFGADPGARAGIEGRRDRALALERRLAVELGRDPAQLAREVLDTADIGTRAQILDARRALWTPLCPLGEEA